MNIRHSACREGVPSCINCLVIEPSTGIAGSQNDQRNVLERRVAHGRGLVEACGWEEKSFQSQGISWLGLDRISRLLILFCDILLRVSNVVFGGFFDPLDFSIRQQAFHFGRGPHDQASRGDVDIPGN